MTGDGVQSSDGVRRPFRDTRTQKEWNIECVESAVFELLPSAQPSQTESKTVAWQDVYEEAKRFDGFNGSTELVRELLADNRLETIDSRETPDGYRVKRALSGDSEQ